MSRAKTRDFSKLVKRLHVSDLISFRHSKRCATAELPQKFERMVHRREIEAYEGANVRSGGANVRILRNLEVPKRVIGEPGDAGLFRYPMTMPPVLTHQ